MKTENFKLPKKVGEHVEYETDYCYFTVTKMAGNLYRLVEVDKKYGGSQRRWGEAVHMLKEIDYSKAEGELQPCFQSDCYLRDPRAK